MLHVRFMRQFVFLPVADERKDFNVSKLSVCEYCFNGRKSERGAH